MANIGDTPASHSPTGASLGSVIERVRHAWGWYVAFGVLSTVLGFIILTYMTVAGTVASVFMIGVAMFMCGCFEITLAFRAKTWGMSILWALAGLLFLVCASITFAAPLEAAGIYTMLLGCSLIATGVVRMVAAFQLAVGKGFVIFSAAISLLLGVMILAAWPMDGLIVLGVFLGVDLLFYGLSWISLGLRLHRHL